MYSRILLPTDGSEAGQRAVEVGIEQASLFGATVHALYVIDERFVPTGYDLPLEEAERDAERALDRVRAMGDRAGVTVERHLRQGVPYEQILNAVDAHEVDLVVIGTHGRTGLDRLTSLGSVTERVVRSSPVPVTTVPLRR